MVGEIRDQETAEVAVRSSMTGHFVLSTLHTNSAVGSVTRLIDMGVERYLLAPMVVGLVAQRLVRRLCPDCRRAGRRDRGAMRCCSTARSAGRDRLARRRLRGMPQRRLSRPHRALRGRRGRRCVPEADPRRRSEAELEAARAQGQPEPARRRRRQGPRRRDHRRGSRARGAGRGVSSGASTSVRFDAQSRTPGARHANVTRLRSDQRWAER